ncbi:unnamed protein product [Lathyrus sativus]|nr:unnamed protein product [Lathyrus sativus]
MVSCESDMEHSDSAIASPLSALTDAFEELVEKVKDFKSGTSDHIRLDYFCEIVSLVTVLFRCLGLAFKFAEMEYVSKLHGLVEASKRYQMLQDIIDHDVANDTVKTSGSYSRNLRRVRQGIDLVRAIFEQLLTTSDISLKEVASTAYGEVCAPYHSWTVRTAVYAGMYTLPTRDQLFLKLNETEKTAEKKMRRYISASLPVIEYIDKLYLSRNIVLDW